MSTKQIIKESDMVNLNEDMYFKVKIEGLPTMYVNSSSREELRKDLVGLLRNPSKAVGDIKRVTPQEVKKRLRLRSQGKEEEEMDESKNEMTQMKPNLKLMKPFQQKRLNDLQKELDSLRKGLKGEAFKPHMMYDPKTGKGYKADKYADHVRMDKMGYTHEKPDMNEVLDKKDEPHVKDLVKKLRKGSKTHAKQADDLEKTLKEKECGPGMYYCSRSKKCLPIKKETVSRLPGGNKHLATAGTKATVMHPVTRIAKKVDKKDIKKYVDMGFKHMSTKRNRVEQTLDKLDENLEGLKNKAKKSGMPLGILKQVFNRGKAAWKTGHRPGTNPDQWGMARVNSFITKSSGTWGKADKDLAAKVREHYEIEDVEMIVENVSSKQTTVQEKTNSVISSLKAFYEYHIDDRKL